VLDPQTGSVAPWHLYPFSLTADIEAAGAFSLRHGSDGICVALPVGCHCEAPSCEHWGSVPCPEGFTNEP